MYLNISVAAIIGQPWGAEYAYHLYKYKLVYQINTVLATNPLLSIAMLIFTLIVTAGLGAFIGYITAYPAIRLREAFLSSRYF